MVEQHSSSKKKMYTYLVFFIKLGKTLCEKHFMKGIEIEDPNANLNALITHFPQILKANDLLQIKSATFSKKLYCSTSSFLKGSLEVKKIELDE
jgi:hypothetical protein